MAVYLVSTSGFNPFAIVSCVCGVSAAVVLPSTAVACVAVLYMGLAACDMISLVGVMLAMFACMFCMSLAVTYALNGRAEYRACALD